MDCLKSIRFKGLVELAKAIWMNEDVPENQNVKFKSSHPPKSLNVYEKDDEWKVVNADDTLFIMMRKMLEFMKKYLYELHHEKCVPSSEDLDSEFVYDHTNEVIDNMKLRKRGSGYTQNKHNIFKTLQKQK
jgi:hypothetical protein